MIKISIIEDDDDFRESLAILINKRAGFRCTSAYPDCESALQNIERDAPDVVLMDIGLPGMSRIEGTQKIKERLPESDILVLTIHEEDETVFDALWIDDLYQLGAPILRDANGQPILSATGKRIPDMIGDQMLWMVYNDLNPGLHGALFGSAPLGIEVQNTVWVFNRPDAFGDMIFLKFLLINGATSEHLPESVFWPEPRRDKSGGTVYDHDASAGRRCDHQNFYAGRRSRQYHR